eukprot:CAMPEP_0177683330 /NCGR_PEP_ID=MMETSP0447-20121125/31748_1 /TAXON_ID=0 /ORGANISM="Stygamoeba regulata, Strain BSH-02190019" /LENGTH=270 /DNA_ID=CAMNT_0019192919 /DNA_START=201 /DNA_END=1013 /DNA_ORIENTATION=+
MAFVADRLRAVHKDHMHLLSAQSVAPAGLLLAVAEAVALLQMRLWHRAATLLSIPRSSSDTSEEVLLHERLSEYLFTLRAVLMDQCAVTPSTPSTPSTPPTFATSSSSSSTSSSTSLSWSVSSSQQSLLVCELLLAIPRAWTTSKLNHMAGQLLSHMPVVYPLLDVPLRTWLIALLSAVQTRNHVRVLRLCASVQSPTLELALICVRREALRRALYTYNVALRRSEPVPLADLVRMLSVCGEAELFQIVHELKVPVRDGSVAFREQNLQI